jgi:hypothetical protein
MDDVPRLSTPTHVASDVIFFLGGERPSHPGTGQFADAEIGHSTVVPLMVEYLGVASRVGKRP